MIAHRWTEAHEPHTNTARGSELRLTQAQSFAFFPDDLSYRSGVERSDFPERDIIAIFAMQKINIPDREN